MVEKVERFKAHDGREFLSEDACLRHEAVEGMIAAVPELALIRPKLEAHLNAISVWCEPLASYLAKTTLEPGAKTTLDPEEMVIKCRYAHPPGSRCPACQEVPRNVTVIPAKEARERARG